MHDLKIISICSKSKINLCQKFTKSHDKDCEIIQKEKYSLSKAENEKILNNIKKYEPFIEDLKKLLKKELELIVKNMMF